MKNCLSLIKKVPFIIEGYLLFVLSIGELERRTENERLAWALWRIIDSHVKPLMIWPVLALLISLVLAVGKKYTRKESLVAITGNAVLIFFVFRFLVLCF